MSDETTVHYLDILWILAHGNFLKGNIENLDKLLWIPRRLGTVATDKRPKIEGKGGRGVFSVRCRSGWNIWRLQCRYGTLAMLDRIMKETGLSITFSP